MAKHAERLDALEARVADLEARLQAALSTGLYQDARPVSEPLDVQELWRRSVGDYATFNDVWGYGLYL